MTTCSHSQHRHSSEEILAHAQAFCEANNLRLTPLRAQVLSLIAKSNGPAKAYTLLDQLKPDHHAAAPPTIYRAVDFLLEHGFIHKIESINAFVACPHPGDSHVAQFLLCDQCSSVTEIDSAELPELLTSLAQRQHFKARKLVVEVHGICRHCSAAH
jgi:Fur family transcriptional regulator, zinc uptake regulator